MNEENDIVLIVEDDLDTAKGLSEIIQEIGIQCLVAHDGLTAFNKIKEFPKNITLVLTDLIMPQMTGLELIQKSISELQYIPFVIMTASNPEKYHEIGKQLGVIDYLSKPFEVSKLLNKIPEWIKAGKDQKLILGFEKALTKIF